MSRAMTRPCGPLPSIRAMSRPASFARRRASGDEKMRAVSPFAFAGCAGAAAGCGAGAGLGSRGLRLVVGLRLLSFRLLSCSARQRVSISLRPARRSLHVLAITGQHRDHLIDRHIGGAFRHQNLRQRALVDRFHFHGRLVGLDLGDHVAGLDRVAFLLEPLGEIALLHRRRQRGHSDVDRHGCCSA